MSLKRRYTFDDQPIYLLGEPGTEFYGQMKTQDFYALRQQCLDSKTLFEDSEFPATDQSLFFSKNAKRQYKWLRPSEICKNPQFFVKGYSRFDVQQGNLFNCWFVAAAANLTLNPKLFSRVVFDDNSFDESLYAGIFHFCFWRFGKWVDVVVDDRLPTEDGKLVYNHSTDNNEFWSALLEKAYAKLNGSYEALIDGNTSEAHEDFTGGITERFQLKEAPPNLFDILVKGFERDSMMGCSIQSPDGASKQETPEGLYLGHAYSITKVKYVDIAVRDKKGKIPLMRLRNPWGNDLEWNGSWSDTSREWQLISVETREELGLTFDFDGEFWMSYNDFLKHFDNLEICNLTPDSLTDEHRSDVKKKWNLNIFEGQWVAGVSSGGCNDREKFYRNPQYIIHLETPDYDSKDGKCSVVIALMQKYRRYKKKMGLDSLAIGFKIYSLTESNLKEKPFKTEFFKYNASIEISTFVDYREVSARYRFVPGYYLIVPATFNPDEEGEFLIRVFSESKNNFEEHDEKVGLGDIDSRIADNPPDVRFPDADWLAVEKVFNDIVSEDKEICWIGLKQILHKFFGDGSVEEDRQNGNTDPNVKEKKHSRSYRDILKSTWNCLSCKKVQNEGSNIPLLNGDDSKKVIALTSQNGKA
ncbi:calpain-B-like [Chironomus tepperi]|uniref:calpain-B-like n=1 Tax=Chironomus tepperi TaxID=113505 RepID=UPI00391F7B37